MTLTLIWLIAFAVILFLSLRGWNGALGRFFERRVPAILKGNEDDRWIWCVALAVLGATFVVKPVSMLLTLLLLALFVWVGVKLTRWSMAKVKSHR